MSTFVEDGIRFQIPQKRLQTLQKSKGKCKKVNENFLYLREFNSTELRYNLLECTCYFSFIGFRVKDYF